MNVFKKIMSTAVATATLLTGAAFPVSATYDDYDLNGDGYVGTADLTTLNRYLNGVYAVLKISETPAH